MPESCRETPWYQDLPWTVQTSRQEPGDSSMDVGDMRGPKVAEVVAEGRKVAKEGTHT